MVSRTTGKVIFKLAHNLSKKLIHKLISENCNKPVRVFSDDYTIYSNLSSHELVDDHQWANHSEKEYVNGIAHNNNCENRNSLLRPFLEIFRGISKKNLSKYVTIKECFLNFQQNFYEDVFKIILFCNDM
jgi:transposase-like protein